jgi:hypothetical protein
MKFILRFRGALGFGGSLNFSLQLEEDAPDHPEAEESCDSGQRPDGRDVQAANYWDVVKDSNGPTAATRATAHTPSVAEVCKGQCRKNSQRAADDAEQKPGREASPALAEHPARDETGNDRPEDDEQNPKHFGRPKTRLSLKTHLFPSANTFYHKSVISSIVFNALRGDVTKQPPEICKFFALGRPPCACRLENLAKLCYFFA